MNRFTLHCGHIVGYSEIIYITYNAKTTFDIFNKYKDKKTPSEIIKKGGEYKENYLVDYGVVTHVKNEEWFTICSKCLFEWSKCTR